MKESQQNQNRQLKVILSFIGIIFLTMIIGSIINNSSKSFDYRGLEIQKMDSGDLRFYKVCVDVIEDNTLEEKCLYLRNDPRKIKADFEGDIFFRHYAFVKEEDEANFFCEGYGTVALKNLEQFYSYFGGQLAYDSMAVCDPKTSYNHIILKSGNSTGVKEVSQGCYEITINDCEIVEGTEKLLFEMLVDAQRFSEENS